MVEVGGIEHTSTTSNNGDEGIPATIFDASIINGTKRKQSTRSMAAAKTMHDFLQCSNLADASNITACMLARACRLALNAAVLSMTMYESLHVKIPESIAIHYLRAGVSLYKYQLIHLGPNHPDLASTLQDVHNAFQGLLENFNNRLQNMLKINGEEFRIDLGIMNNVAVAAATELHTADIAAIMRHCKAETGRIKCLHATANKYPDSLLIHVCNRASDIVSDGVEGGGTAKVYWGYWK